MNAVLGLARRAWQGFFFALARICFRLGGERGLPREWDRPPPPAVDTTAPLTAAELQALADFLREHHVHHGFLDDLHALDGFLTCICIGPVSMPTENWMTAIFAHDFDAIDADEIDHQYPQIARLFHKIAAQLSQQPATYRPLFETHPGLGRARRYPLHAWCQGFMTATVLCDAEWESLLRQPGMAMLSYPIWECASVDEWPPARRRAKSSPKRGGPAVDATQLKNFALTVNAYWREGRLARPN